MPKPDNETENSTTIPAPSLTSTAMICSNLQCERIAAPPTSSTLTLPSAPVQEPDLKTAMATAAGKGFLFSFIFSLPAEYIKDLLKQYHFGPHEISLASDTINSMGYACLSGSAKPLSIPFISYALEYLGMKEFHAKLAAVASVYAFDVVLHPENLSAIDVAGAATVLASTAASVAGQEVGKLCYRHVC